jgi:hypothetical protein
MADQFVSKIGNTYIVSVRYQSETLSLMSASFGSATGAWQMVWNLMNMGEDAPAVFDQVPIECKGSGSCSLKDIRRINDTQCSAVLSGKTDVLQPVHYVIRVKVGAQLLTHDPTIVVSPDPVEIP